MGSRAGDDGEGIKTEFEGERLDIRARIWEWGGSSSDQVILTYMTL